MYWAVNGAKPINQDQILQDEAVETSPEEEEDLEKEEEGTVTKEEEEATREEPKRSAKRTRMAK